MSARRYDAVAERRAQLRETHLHPLRRLRPTPLSKLQRSLTWEPTPSEQPATPARQRHFRQAAMTVASHDPRPATRWPTCPTLSHAPSRRFLCSARISAARSVLGACVSDTSARPSGRYRGSSSNAGESVVAGRPDVSAVGLARQNPRRSRGSGWWAYTDSNCGPLPCEGLECGDCGRPCPVLQRNRAAGLRQTCTDEGDGWHADGTITGSVRGPCPSSTRVR